MRCRCRLGKERRRKPLGESIRWFGYKLYLVVDATYEIPVGFRVTKASCSEVKEAHKLLEEMAKKTPATIKKCRYFLGDRGYDDGKLITKLWINYGIKPLIDIRNLWRDRGRNQIVSGQTNVVYNYKGQVYCHCPKTNKRLAMAYGGFEKDRGPLKYRCPARHYGTKCVGGIEECRVKSGVRIPLKEDRRIFTPVARSSYLWKSLYKKRTAVERVNSRLDRAFGFEQHYIRGLKKMKTRCTLALTVMLAMALGRVKEKDRETLRSLVKVA